MKTKTTLWEDFIRYMESEEDLPLIEGVNYELKNGSHKYSNKIVVFTDVDVKRISGIFEWAWEEQQDRLDEMAAGDDW